MAQADPVIRPFAEPDRAACRGLWAELTEHHRRIYGDPTIGGSDPGRYFDEYMRTPELAGIWVADLGDGRDDLAGLAGLLDHGDSGEVEPVVVAEAHRGRGIGRRLVDAVIEQARHHDWEYLTIRPVARNVDAISAFHAAGFRTLGGHVDLSMDLAARRHEWRHGATLHGLEFDY